MNRLTWVVMFLALAVVGQAQENKKNKKKANSEQTSSKIDQQSNVYAPISLNDNETSVSKSNADNRKDEGYEESVILSKKERKEEERKKKKLLKEKRKLEKQKKGKYCHKCGVVH